MDHEDLTASHWDDVISPGSNSEFGSSTFNGIVPILNNEFNDLAIDTNSTFNQGDTYNSSSDPNGSDGTSEKEDDSVNINLNEAELEQINELKKEEMKEHRTQLISELTFGAEDNVLEESMVSPKKIDASEFLFDVKDSPIKIRELNKEKQQENLSSPKRSSQINNIKLYKTPRPRKFNSKTIVKHLASSENEYKDPLGPLGLESDDAKSIDEMSVQSNSKAEQLVKETHAPLYDIPNQSEEDRLKELAKDFPTHSEHISDKPSDSNGSVIEHNVENFTKLQITVGDPMKIGDLTTAHIVYSIKTKSKDSASNDFPDNEDGITVSRRYKDFRWIYHQLQNNHPGRIIPPPPSKQTYIGRFNENFIENRRLSLEKMLNKISSMPVLNNDPDFRMFLISEDFANESRERERLSNSGASIQNNDLLDNENGVVGDINVSSSGGALSANNIITGSGNFMSSLFSMSSKVNDPDDYFSNKSAYFEDLEINLKNFYKSIELIGIQRSEMVNIISEISMTVDELASLEFQKPTSDLLTAFSEVQLKLKESLDRINLQDQLTLGFTIEEYLRIIGSIKFVLETRDKVFQQYQTFNQDLIKKQGQLDKSNKKYKMQVDKINMLTFEVDMLKKKTAAYEEKCKVISNTIKSELDRFELEKIDDFRNSVEIFIESSIESQKEAIELWETFYERQNLGQA